MLDRAGRGATARAGATGPEVRAGAATLDTPAVARRTALVAIGGNSLIRAGEKGTVSEQIANVHRTAQAILVLIKAGVHLVITHGNGPQVGAALLRSERAVDQVPALTLDVCGAATQGEIGYMLQQALRSETAAIGLDIPVAAVVSQAVVSADDRAFLYPTKPIGPFYSQAEAEERQRTLGWSIVEDASRGYRRVVASPEPLEIVEEDVIRALLDRGALVIAVGGGGIPVIRRNGRLEGVEAVIDKDRASALLASRLGVEMLVISTDADRVYLDYKKPAERPIDRATVAEMERYYAEGQFPPGNMGPKVEAALRFLRNGGHEVIITSYELLAQAVGGTAGTHIVP